jgi:hypothetical protein
MFFKVQEPQFDPEVGGHELKARHVLGHRIEIAQRPKFVADHFLPLPSESLNPSETGLISWPLEPDILC